MQNAKMAKTSVQVRPAFIGNDHKAAPGGKNFGFMEAEELTAVLIKEYRYRTKWQVYHLIRERDTDGDGKVCFEEYFQQ